MNTLDATNAPARNAYDSFVKSSMIFRHLSRRPGSSASLTKSRGTLRTPRRLSVRMAQTAISPRWLVPVVKSV